MPKTKCVVVSNSRVYHFFVVSGAGEVRNPSRDDTPSDVLRGDLMTLGDSIAVFSNSSTLLERGIWFVTEVLESCIKNTRILALDKVSEDPYMINKRLRDVPSRDKKS